MISAACHKKPFLLYLVVSDYHIGLYRQPRQFCETSAEVKNYIIIAQKLNFDVFPKASLKKILFRCSGWP